MTKKRVMVFCDSYLPGYTSGGAMQMILNIVERFADRYDFYIVTRNYDSRSNKAVYTTVTTDQWNAVAGAQVFYFSKGNLNSRFFAKLVDEVGADAILLNSTFSTPSVALLRSRRKRLIGDIPVVLAPCGSLSPPSLSFRPLKKKLFLKYASASRLFDGVTWKASFESEKQEIKRAIGASVNVMVAPDLTPTSVLPDFDSSWKPEKIPGSVDFVYFSRLERKKNILFFLERLLTVRGRVNLTFVGPLEDQPYWRECKQIIARLPENITVEIGGTFPNKTDALRKVAQSHFFVLPTLNENFGYVFIESLAAGCPNLTSDNTVWTDLEEKGAGWRIPLENIPEWNEAIDRCIEMDNERFSRMALAARRYAVERMRDTSVESLTNDIFKKVLNEERKSVSVKSLAQ